MQNRNTKLSYYYLAQASIVYNQFNVEKDTVATIKFIDELIREFRDYKDPLPQDYVEIHNIKSIKFLLTKAYDSAFYYNNKSIAFYKAGNNEFDIIKNQQRDIEIFFQKYKKLKDKAAVEKMAAAYVQEKSFGNGAILYNMLYLNAKSNNNIPDALRYLEKDVVLNDSVLKQNQKGQLFEYEKKFESEKKEKKIAVQ